MRRERWVEEGKVKRGGKKKGWGKKDVKSWKRKKGDREWDMFLCNHLGFHEANPPAHYDTTCSSHHHDAPSLFLLNAQESNP